MSKIAARFWVQSVKKTCIAQGNYSREVIMAPVVRPATTPGGEGNVDWSKYTPSGEIRLVITNELTGSLYDDAVGKDVAITMVIIEPDAPDTPAA